MNDVSTAQSVALHLRAAEYANRQKEARIAYRVAQKLFPHDDDPENVHWLTAYEGFRAGWNAAK